MAIKAKPTFSLKDQLFNAEKVRLLSDGIRKNHQSFNRAVFERTVLDAFPNLELKQRIDWIVTVLEAHLPDDFSKAARILETSLPAELDPTKTDDDFGQFIWVVPSEYAARHGCSKKHLKRSLGLLKEGTKRFSSEFAIRPFLNAFPEQTLRFIHDCTGDENYHVRRLASEGIRPLLPWAQRVQLDSAQILDVLERLYADRTRYVTRSVSNCLNDVSKSDPSSVLKALRRWRSSGLQDKAEMDWMTRHALRSLFRENHRGALNLMGYKAKPQLHISHFEAQADTVSVGNEMAFELQMSNEARQGLKLLLRVYFLKANGDYSIKVFQLKDGLFAAGEIVEVTKKVAFRPMTTRALYPGMHHAELIINGESRGKVSFELTE